MSLLERYRRARRFLFAPYYVINSALVLAYWGARLAGALPAEAELLQADPVFVVPRDVILWCARRPPTSSARHI